VTELPQQDDPSVSTVAQPASQVDDSSVLAALQSVLRSDAFARAPRSRELLAFVVTEELAGRGGRLSERTVGRRALDRGPDFDGRTDSLVRVQASRVRTALERYYAEEGGRDPLRIRLPAGTYRPSFETAPPDGAAVSGLAPGVAILTFGHQGDESARQVAVSLSEAIVARLARFPDTPVFGPIDGSKDGVRDAALRLGLRWALNGSVAVRGEVVRLRARLVDATTGAVAWATELTASLEDLMNFAVEDAWATGIAAELGDWTGVISRAETSDPSPTSSSAAYASRLAFFAYQEDPSAAAVARAAEKLDLAIAAGDRSVGVLAMRAWMYAAGVAYMPEPRDLTKLAPAEELARECLRLDGSHAPAYIVLSHVALIREQWDTAARHAARAAELAPHHPTLLFAAATGIALSGDWDRGRALVQESFRLNPHLPSVYHVLPALAAFVAGDDAGALAEASMIDAAEHPWGPLYRALALAGLGYEDQARAEVERLLAAHPGFLDDPMSYFTRGMRCSESQLAHIESRLALLTRAAD
jgi:TolB-like protein